MARILHLPSHPLILFAKFSVVWNSYSDRSSVRIRFHVTVHESNLCRLFIGCCHITTSHERGYARFTWPVFRDPCV